MNHLPPSPSARRWLGVRPHTRALALALLVIALGALELDLAAHGRIYDALWNLTGETAPAQQILGFGQYLMRYTREQPETQPFAALQDNYVSPFGVNTFLEQEVEPAKRERQAQMIAAAGFGWIRQQFPWSDIEIHAKGDFEDRRNPATGVVSAWAKYDQIVALTQQYGLGIIARLGAPPAWSQPLGTSGFTPPADFQDFVDYAVTVAQRYRGRITHYQVWNEPNLYPEWGEQTVNAEAYTDLLCRTYTALKAVDPAIVVISGALGPTVDLSGRNAYDLLYLQRMYQAGAGACFDVLSVQGYGLWSGPTDRRLRQVTINYPRHLWIRDMMIANGDAHKPIWISEAGWNPVPDDPGIADAERYGRVTMDEAAAWAPLAYARALEEWPWIGVISWWYFKPADERNSGDSSYYFRLVEPDFTPTPVYEALKVYLTNGAPKTIGAGRHGARAAGVPAAGAAAGTETTRYRIQGTGVNLCYDNTSGGEEAIAYTLDERSGSAIIPAGAAGCAALGGSLGVGTHALVLTRSADGDSPVTSLIVADFAARHRLPWLLTGALAALGVGWVLGAALNRRWGA